MTVAKSSTFGDTIDDQPDAQVGRVSSANLGIGVALITRTLATSCAGGRGKSGATSCSTAPTSAASSSVMGGIAKNSLSCAADQGRSIGPASPDCASKYQHGWGALSRSVAGGSVCRTGRTRVSGRECHAICPRREGPVCSAHGSPECMGFAVGETNARPVAMSFSARRRRLCPAARSCR